MSRPPRISTLYKLVYHSFNKRLLLTYLCRANVSFKSFPPNILIIARHFYLVHAAIRPFAITVEIEADLDQGSELVSGDSTTIVSRVRRRQLLSRDNRWPRHNQGWIGFGANIIEVVHEAMSLEKVFVILFSSFFTGRCSALFYTHALE